MIRKLLESLKTDFHIPIAIVVFTSTTVYHFVSKHDLGPQYVNSLYAMYAFLGGHAFLNRNNGVDSYTPDQPQYPAPPIPPGPPQSPVG